MEKEGRSDEGMGTRGTEKREGGFHRLWGEKSQNWPPEQFKIPALVLHTDC